MFGTSVYEKVRKMVTKENKFVITEMFIVKANTKNAEVQDITKKMQEMTVEKKKLPMRRSRRNQTKILTQLKF